jgi:hypothetical protein
MDWQEYFLNNAAKPDEIPWNASISVEAELRLPLIRSLQRFQVGEQGDGRHLISSARAKGDRVYACTIELFVKEEQHHAEMLARLLRGMGAPLLSWHWSDAAFVTLRRLLGLRVELMVLLTAEMMAKRYYRALYEGTADPMLRAAFLKILNDEFGHVAFHTDYLHNAFSSRSHLARLSMCWLWCVFFGVVCRVVAYDHRGVLEATGVSERAFRRDCAQIFEETAALIFQPRTAVEQLPAE